MNTFCAKMNLQLLQELKFMCPEVGGLEAARSLPREIRRWWIDTKQNEIQEQNEAIEKARRGTRSQDVR